MSLDVVILHGRISLKLKSCTKVCLKEVEKLSDVREVTVVGVGSVVTDTCLGETSEEQLR